MAFRNPPKEDDGRAFLPCRQQHPAAKPGGGTGGHFSKNQSFLAGNPAKKRKITVTSVHTNYSVKTPFGIIVS
ncbi:hypothetical protein [Fontivita pretiosa]|uniref:hypothetical protein n=1 Tax=Fontivita pretiosa TaxID=2989684 RepID=UPI003D16E29C